jgi:hypothetical protein
MAFAGQSLVLNSSSNISVTDPVLPPNQSWRIEFQIHNWTPTPAGNYGAMLFNLQGTGSLTRIYPGGTLEIEGLDRVAQQQPCFVSTNGRTPWFAYKETFRPCFSAVRSGTTMGRDIPARSRTSLSWRRDLPPEEQLVPEHRPHSAFIANDDTAAAATALNPVNGGIQLLQGHRRNLVD